MNTNQKGFSIVETLAAIAFLGLISGAAWFVWQKNDTQTANNSQSTNLSDNNTKSSINKSIKSLTEDMNIELVTTSNFSNNLIDEDNGPRSHQVQSALYFIDETEVLQSYQKLVENLDKSNWLIDGEKASELRLTKQVSDAEVSPFVGMSLLSTNLFGDQSYFQNSERIAYFTVNKYGAANNEGMSESDWEYTIKSSAPAPEEFDYQSKILDVLRSEPNKVLFTITASE